MKPKYYRSSAVKGLLLILAHAAAAIAAVCLFILIYLASTYQITLLEKTDNYEDSVSFSHLLSQDALHISNYIRQKSQKEDLASVKDPVLDLKELWEDQRLTYQKTSELAYSLDTLKAWSENGYMSTDTENGLVEDAIVICQKPDGRYEYLYYSDFMAKIKKKDLAIILAGGYTHAEASDRLEQIYQTLSDSSMTEGLGSFGAGSYVAGPDGSSVEYQDICSYQGVYLFDEKHYPPKGADSLLEAVSDSDYWNQCLSRAFYALEEALNLAGSGFVVDTGHDFSAYEEENTNLSYYFLDKTNGRVLTNRSAYKTMKPEKALEQAKKQEPYVCFYPQDFEMEGLSQILDQQPTMQDLVDERLMTEDYVLLLSVDTSYPAADAYQKGAEAYLKYSSCPVKCVAIILFCLVVFVIALVWLTVISGQRSQDEKIHLLFFDRWFLEIFAAGVLALWMFPINLLGIQLTSDLVNNLRFSLPLAFCLGIYTAFCFFFGYLSLVRRVKGKILWKNSCLHFALHLARLALKKAVGILIFFEKNTINKIKLSLGCIFVLFLQFFFCALIFSNGSEVFLLFLFLLDLALLALILIEADGRDQILEGLKRISDGQLSYKIPLKRLYGDQKRMAEYINNIGGGLDAAVDKSLKNERMKTELITNVSHDLKTPLTSIINYVDLLKRENFTDPKICGYLDVLEEKAQRLKSLTEDVVEASKASTGNITLEMADLNFTELLHQVLGEFEERFQNRNLTMVVNLAHEPSVIYADGQRLWRVLENIFGNVTKYALEGTRVYVEVANQQDKVCFSLKNISAQPLNFDAQELTLRFIRGDVSRSTEGSGLGLSIAKSLTELMGGEFHLYLDGDLFKVTITFPVSPRS